MLGDPTQYILRMLNGTTSKSVSYNGEGRSRMKYRIAPRAERKS
jgi:hypothetical protein